MKKLLVAQFLFCLCSSSVLAESLTVEFDNRGGVWSPRMAAFFNPVSDFMIDLRKGPGGKHLQAFVGWNFTPAEGLSIQPYLGLGFADNDDLHPIYFHPEVLLYWRSWKFKESFCISYGQHLDKKVPDTLYLSESLAYLYGKFFVAAMTDIVLLTQNDGEIAFWRLGPNIGYNAWDRLLFTVWPNWEYKASSWGVRFGATLSF